MKSQGQSTVEVAILLMIIAGVLIVMMKYIKLSVGGRVKETVTQLSGTPYISGKGSYNISIEEDVNSVRTLMVEENSNNPTNDIVSDNTVSARVITSVKEVSVGL